MKYMIKIILGIGLLTHQTTFSATKERTLQQLRHQKKLLELETLARLLEGDDTPEEQTIRKAAYEQLKRFQKQFDEEDRRKLTLQTEAEKICIEMAAKQELKKIEEQMHREEQAAQEQRNRRRLQEQKALEQQTIQNRALEQKKEEQQRIRELLGRVIQGNNHTLRGQQQTYEPYTP